MKDSSIQKILFITGNMNIKNHQNLKKDEFRNKIIMGNSFNYLFVFS